MRKSNGRFRGNLYALHDEPLPLADVIHLDRSYMEFLRKAEGHSHARVRLVATGMLASIDEDIQNGHDPCSPEHPIERRLQSLSASEHARPRRFFSFTPRVIRQLRKAASDGGSSQKDHDQNSNPAKTPVQNSDVQDSNAGSSNNKKGSSPNQVGNIHRQIPSGYRSSPPRWK